MFQYAFGLSKARTRGTVLKMDLRAFEKDPLRKFVLDCFQLEGTPAGPQELDSFNPSVFQKAWAKLGLPGRLDRRVYWEPHFHFDPRAAADQKSEYYGGYWQSEKYFVNQAEAVRNNFRIRPELIVDVQNLAEKEKAEDSISLHIRRGDYVSNPQANSYHGTCTPEYYRRALELACTGLKKPKLYIITDDPQWVSQETTWPLEYEILSGRGFSDIQEFYLMTQVKKMIIANSSFSWWAAWLNPGAEVFAPQRWFGSAGHDTKDLIPDHWTKVEA